MEANLQAELASIASDRKAVIDDIVAMWPTEPGGEEDLSGADIQVFAKFANVHAVVQVLGYFHEINGEDIAASASSGTITVGINVGHRGDYTTLASRVVTVPVRG